VAILKREPLAPRLGKGGLCPVQRFGKAVGGQARRNNRARDGPHPWPILRRAGAAEDAADGALAVQHVPIIRVARSDAVIARAAKLQRHVGDRPQGKERGDD
jgi:hypothetical protein